MKELFNAIKQKAIELGFELKFNRLEEDLNKAINHKLDVNFRHIKTDEWMACERIMGGTITYTYIGTGQEHKTESNKNGWSNLSLMIITDVIQLKRPHRFEVEITAFNSEQGIYVEVL